MKIYCPQTEKKSYYKKFTFPAGEDHLYLDKEVLEQPFIDIEFNFSRSEDIFELLLLANTLQINKVFLHNLIIPYMPFGQADRVNEVGECFSLRLFCELINNVVKPELVTVFDPHSDVTPALLNNCRVVPQWEILAPIIEGIFPQTTGSFTLVSPDAGAEKKTNKLAQLLEVDVIYCRKIRDTKTGNITGTEVYCDEDLKGGNYIIVDDCVVGGRTFIEIAKILRSRNAGSIILCTTNGLYSNGLEVFSDFDMIFNRKGRIK